MSWRKVRSPIKLNVSRNSLIRAQLWSELSCISTVIHLIFANLAEGDCNLLAAQKVPINYGWIRSATKIIHSTTSYHTSKKVQLSRLQTMLNEVLAAISPTMLPYSVRMGGPLHGSYPNYYQPVANFIKKAYST